VEEPWEDLVPVGIGHHPRELDHARQAEPSVPDRLDDLRKFRHQAGGDLAVVGRASGEPEFPVEVVEECGEAEFAVEGQPVELCKGDEQVGETATLPAEELGMAERPFACVHAATLSRDYRPSGIARGWPPLRDLA